MDRWSAWSRPSWASVSGCTSPTFFSQPVRSINGNDAVRLPAALSRLERPGRGSRRHVGSYPCHSHAHAYAAGEWRLTRKTAAHADAIAPCRAMAGACAHPHRIFPRQSDPSAGADTFSGAQSTYSLKAVLGLCGVASLQSQHLSFGD